VNSSAPKRSDYPPGDEGHRAYQRSLYYANKPMWHAARANRRQQDVKYIDELKSEIGCADCKNSHPAVLQFHHPNGLEGKVRLKSGKHSIGVIEAALSAGAIVVLCSNCHLIRHYNEKSGFFGQKERVK